MLAMCSPCFSSNKEQGRRCSIHLTIFEVWILGFFRKLKCVVGYGLGGNIERPSLNTGSGGLSALLMALCTEAWAGGFFVEHSKWYFWLLGILYDSDSEFRVIIIFYYIQVKKVISEPSNDFLTETADGWDEQRLSYASLYPKYFPSLRSCVKSGALTSSSPQHPASNTSLQPSLGFSCCMTLNHCTFMRHLRCARHLR